MPNAERGCILNSCNDCCPLLASNTKRASVICSLAQSDHDQTQTSTPCKPASQIRRPSFQPTHTLTHFLRTCDYYTLATRSTQRRSVPWCAYLNRESEQACTHVQRNFTNAFARVVYPTTSHAYRQLNSAQLPLGEDSPEKLSHASTATSSRKLKK